MAANRSESSEAQRGRVRVERSSKRVRAVLDGTVVVDSTHAWLVWEKPYYPTYYFPLADVRTEVLSELGASTHSPSRGDATVYDLVVGERSVAEAAYRYEQSPMEELRGLISFRWAAMDHWFEEDVEVYVHARDPHTRVDVLPSSRHVRVDVDGVTIAESHRPTLLFETGLPVRYYFPKPDVRLELLTPTETVSSCPYKGEARYWSVDADGATYDDLAWGYDHPLPESIGVAGLISFWNERTDITVDGELQERPSRR